MNTMNTTELWDATNEAIRAGAWGKAVRLLDDLARRHDNTQALLVPLVGPDVIRDRIELVNSHLEDDTSERPTEPAPPPPPSETFEVTLVATSAEKAFWALYDLYGIVGLPDPVTAVADRGPAWIAAAQSEVAEHQAHLARIQSLLIEAYRIARTTARGEAEQVR